LGAPLWPVTKKSSGTRPARAGGGGRARRMAGRSNIHCRRLRSAKRGGQGAGLSDHPAGAAAEIGWAETPCWLGPAGRRKGQGWIEGALEGGFPAALHFGGFRSAEAGTKRAGRRASATVFSGIAIFRSRWVPAGPRQGGQRGEAGDGGRKGAREKIWGGGDEGREILGRIRRRLRPGPQRRQSGGASRPAGAVRVARIPAETTSVVVGDSVLDWERGAGGRPGPGWGGAQR